MPVSDSNTANNEQAAVSTTTSSYASQSIGAAAADRLVFCWVAQLSFISGPTISAVTIGGVSATQVGAGISINAGGFFWRLSLWWAAVPTGTTATVALTINSIAGASSTFTSISLYRVVGASTSDPVSSSSFTSDVGPSASIGASLTIPVNGAGIGMVTSGDDGANAPKFTWTNLTEDVDRDIDAGTGTARSAASSTTAGTATRTADIASGSSSGMLLGLVALKIPGGATDKSVSVTQTATVTVQRAAGKRLTISQAVTAALRRSSGKLVIIGQAQVVAIRNQIGKLIRVTQAASLVLFPAAVRPKTIAVTQASTVSLVRQFAKNQMVTITQASVAALAGRSIGKIVAVTQAQALVLRRAISNRLIAVTQAISAVVIKGVGKPVQVLQATFATLGPASVGKFIRVLQAHSLVVRRNMERRVSVTQGQNVTLVPNFAKNVQLAVTQALNALVIKSVRKRIVVTQASIAAMGSFAFGKAIKVTQASTVIVRRSVGHIVAVAQATVVSLVRAIVRFARPRLVAEPVWLLDVQVYNPDTLTVEVKRFSSVTISTKPSDSPANTVYDGRLINAGSIERKMFENGGTIGGASTNVGYFELNNADGALDYLLDYGFGGWPFTLRLLSDKDALVSTATNVFVGTLRGFASPNLATTLQLRIRDRMDDLDKPFLSERYAGSTNSSDASAEGTVDLRGVLKPRSYGSVLQAPVMNTNPFDLIYQGAANEQEALLRPSDGGDVFTSASPGDYATLADLRNATTGAFGSGAAIEAGEYATCKALGLFRLAAEPAKVLTVEMKSSSTEAEMSAGAVAKQILLDAGFSSLELDTASFDAASSSSSNLRVGIYIDSDRKVRECVNDVLNSVGATLIADATGKFKVVSLGFIPTTLLFNPIFDDETAVATFTNDDLVKGSKFTLQASPQAEGDGVPAWAINIKFNRLWRPLSRTELAASIGEDVSSGYTKEYFELAQANLSTRTKHPLAQFLDFATLITSPTGAIIQGFRRVDYYSNRRDYITFSVPTAKASGVDIGNVVIVKPTLLGIPRYGYGINGKKVCIIGRNDVFGKAATEFTAWG